MKKDLLDCGILLVYTAERAMTKRRSIEKMCGYPSEYGDDGFVLNKMREYLEMEEVHERLVEILAEIKKLQK